LVRWALESDRELGEAPSIERYLSDERSTPPSEAVTEISLRLI
jgi:effector-binding domain-containing protein